MIESLRAWLRELEEPLPALSARQRLLLVAVCAIAVLSRLVAISRSLWDSDEARFALALREFDVAEHRPHPPGFPLFIAMAKLAGLTGLDEFRSLQIVVVVAAMVLAPAMFALCRELRAPYAVSLAATALLVFLPNVWFYGGTAFSDVPATMLLVAAMALLLRAIRSAPPLAGGAILLGMAASMRPQCLLIAAVPIALLALRRPRRAILAILVVLGITAVSYGLAAQATGWTRYGDALRAHRAYITSTDSFRSEIRPPLHRLADDFFVRPFRAPLINAAISVLILVSLVSAFRRRRASPIVFLIVFAPFCVLAWLTLDHFSASRFSIAYAPLMAFLAADGLHVTARGHARIMATGAAALVAAMIFWTWPSLTEVRRNSSPPVLAFEAIRDTPASRLAVAVDPRLEAHAMLLLGGFARRDEAGPSSVSWRSGEEMLLLREEFAPRAGARMFTRPHDRLWWLARQRYFDLSLMDAGKAAFGEGWFPEESELEVHRDREPGLDAFAVFERR